MSIAKHPRIIGAACAALVVLAACGPEQTPSLVPNVERLDVPVGLTPIFPDRTSWSSASGGCRFRAAERASTRSGEAGQHVAGLSGS
jgi:hypothetical protein